jgi:hypothetical protein
VRVATSEKYRRYVRAITHASRKIGMLTACFPTEKATGLTWADWSEEERAQLKEASRLFEQAKRTWSAVWAKRIGEQIMREEGP